MKSVNDFRFSGPASDKRRYWGDERHIRLMAKKRLRPVVIVGYALLLHEADARAQSEAVIGSVRLGLHAVLRVPQDEVIACAAFDVIAARAAKEHIFCAAAVNVVAARFAADPVASLVALAVVPLPLIIVTGAP